MSRKRQMSDEWKERARARFAAGDITHRQAEAKLGAGSGTISRMLSPKQSTSEFVDSLSEILGIEPPHAETRSDDEVAILTAYRSMDEATQKAVLRLLGLAARLPD